MATRVRRRTTKARKATRRDIEKVYPRRQFVAKLRRLARAIERGDAFTIQVAGESLRIPADALVNIEHEREGRAQELEFQVKWSEGSTASKRG